MSEKNKIGLNIISKIPFLSKIKNIKGIEWIVICSLCLLIFIIYYSSITNDKASINYSNPTSSTSEYAKEIEEKLCNVLSNVAGAGKVSVMVTLECGTEIKVATSKEERTNYSSGTSSNTQSVTVVENPVIIGKEPLVVLEILPKIKGVIVVAQGANNVSVRLELLRAVQTLIDVNSNQIEIFVGK